MVVGAEFAFGEVRGSSNTKTDFGVVGEFGCGAAGLGGAMRTITAALASRIAATMCRILNHGKRDAKAAKVQANAASISLSNERSLIVFIVVVVGVDGVRIG